MEKSLFDKKKKYWKLNILSYIYLKELLIQNI